MDTAKLGGFMKMLSELKAIPAHDPERFETTDGLDNPDCTNEERATLALEALDYFQNACGMNEDVDTAASDIICDLLHLVHSRGFDLRLVLHNGLGSFLCEAGRLSEIADDSDS